MIKMGMMDDAIRETVKDKEFKKTDIKKLATRNKQIVDVTDTIKMVMKYPQLSDMQSMKNTTENIFKLLMQCITEVRDGDTIHNRADISDKELAEFVDSFNTNQLQSLMRFFETMPKVRHIINVTNPNTKVTSEVVLEGMDSFLG